VACGRRGNVHFCLVRPLESPHGSDCYQGQPGQPDAQNTKRSDVL
jgi:hypothetical protein